MEHKFKIGQKVMIAKPLREEDKFKVGTIVGYYIDHYDVEFDEGKKPTVYHESRLKLLPEMLQGKTIEEAQKTVKAVVKTAESIGKMAKAGIETAKSLMEASEAMSRASEELKQEADKDKDKEIAELKKQLTDERQKRNEHIAVELVKAWTGQEGVPVSLDTIMEAYRKTLKELQEAEIKP